MKIIPIILFTSLMFCTGCAYCGNVRTVQRQSNLAIFLFGGGEPQFPGQKTPLTLPVKVGVTFVPGDHALANIPETIKNEVIESVRSQLTKHTKYVSAAYSIPSTYLSPKGGVNNLEQVARQFDVDVIVILDANQFQKHERNPLAAFMDITIIGTFLIPGNTVDTSTVLEAAVYHVPSRSLIFRTNGTDEKSSRSTQFGSSQSAQSDAVSGIEDASKKLVRSIAAALVSFEKFDVSKAPEIRPIATPPGKSVEGQENYWARVGEYRSTGGGSFDAAWIVMVGAALLCSTKTRKRY